VLYRHPLIDQLFWVDPGLDHGILDRLNRLPGVTVWSVCAGHAEEKHNQSAVALEIPDGPRGVEALRRFGTLGRRCALWHLIVGYVPESQVWWLRLEFPWSGEPAPPEWWSELAATCEGILS